jgi:DNA adenine methylase
VEILNSVNGFAAISNYDCEHMEELYPKNKWIKIYAPEKTIHSTKDIRQEVLWVNYNPHEFIGKEGTDNFLFTLRGE